jgi:hypothetical protein
VNERSGQTRYTPFPVTGEGFCGFSGHRPVTTPVHPRYGGTGPAEPEQRGTTAGGIGRRHGGQTPKEAGYGTEGRG